MPKIAASTAAILLASGAVPAAPQSPFADNVELMPKAARLPLLGPLRYNAAMHTASVDYRVPYADTDQMGFVYYGDLGHQMLCITTVALDHARQMLER